MPAAAPVPAEPAIDRWSAGRSVYLDNLKVLLIAAVIVVHAVLGYVATPSDAWWPYANVQETQIGPFLTVVLFAVAGPFALFMMALLFLIAGLLTPASVARKGPRRFARDRFVKLGLPFSCFTLLLWPVALYALYRPFGHVTKSYAAEFADSFPDTGPLWFVGVLLVFSLGYAGWVALRRAFEGRGGRSGDGAPGNRPGAHPDDHQAGRQSVPREGRPAGAVGVGRRPRHRVNVGIGWLVLLAAVVAAMSFVIRIWLPYGTQTPLDLNEWQWPECLGMFAVGIIASRKGWIARVPDNLARRCGVLAMSGAVAMVLLAAVGALLGVEVDDIVGGGHWPGLVFAALTAILTVFGSIWLLRLAQRRLDRPLPLGPQLARSAYAAFLLQAFVLLALAVALRWLPAPAEAKALIVAVGGLVGSFGLGWLVVSRVPWLARL